MAVCYNQDTEQAFNTLHCDTLPGPMYICRLIGLNMFTPIVGLTGGQQGDLNFSKGLTQELK